MEEVTLQDNLDKKGKKVWNAIFPPKIGDRVKIVRIYIKNRVKNYPRIAEFIGLGGKIIDISTGLADKDGWWDDVEEVRRKRPKAIRVPSYSVLLNNETTWSFMREDFEVIEVK